MRSLAFESSLGLMTTNMDERIKKVITQEQIDEALNGPESFIYFGELPIGKTWSIGPVIQHRDSTLIDRSNARALKDTLEFEHSEWSEDWAIESMSHWAVGWVEHLCFRAVNEDGTPTEIFEFVLDWLEDLRGYPLADEDLYSEMEMAETIENIEWIGGGYLIEDYPEDWALTVYDWFWDNNQQAIENRDDQGGWPSDREMKEALRELNLLAEEYIEE